jgi:hypothetical protein
MRYLMTVLLLHSSCFLTYSVVADTLVGALRFSMSDISTRRLCTVTSVI